MMQETVFTDALEKCFRRDLQRLQAELAAYPSEEDLWRLGGEISNCAGNLSLHLIGNLNHFIGTRLGGTAYKRNRPAEFSGKNVPRSKMLDDVQELLVMIPAVLRKLTVAELESDYPEDVFGGKMTTAYFLIHLAGHLNYHLGQINYHRRLLAASGS